MISYDEKGEMKDIALNENGEVKAEVKIKNNSKESIPVDIQNQSVPVEVGNTSSNAIPVNVQNQSVSVEVENDGNNPVPVELSDAVIVGNTSNQAVPVEVGNTASNAIPVNIKNIAGIDPVPVDISYQSDYNPLKVTVEDKETTLSVNVINNGFGESIQVNNASKVTEIDIANCGSTPVTVIITGEGGQKTYVIEKDLSVTLKINKFVGEIRVQNATPGKVTVIVKGVENNVN